MLRYAITDRSLYGTSETARRAALLAQASQLARSGVDFLQLREKDLPAGALVTLARELLAQFEQHTRAGTPRPRLLVSSRPDVAMAAGADGVHLTSSPGELLPRQVRTLYEQARLPPPIISISCHTLADIERVASAAQGSPPDLILFGPVFEKVVRLSPKPMDRPLAMAGLHPIEGPRPDPLPVGSPPPLETAKVHHGTGLDLLAACCRIAAPIRVLALGGITRENAPACLHAGAAGIAAIRLFQLDPRAASY